MTEDTNTEPNKEEEEAAAALEASELAALKKKADGLGIGYHPSIKAAALREKLKDDVPDDITGDDQLKVDANAKEAADNAKLIEEGKISSVHQTKRVIVQCMVQAKKEYKGEFFTVSNAKLGTITKYVHFGVPWHIPELLLSVLQEKKHQVFTKKKNTNGVDTREGRLVRAYSIEVMPDLTEVELEELKKQQIIADGRLTEA